MTAEKTILKCSQCSKEFKYDSERKRHEQSHVPQFACKVCKKTFSFISALRRHEKQHERIGTVTCNICDKAFRDNVLLKRHMKYAHEGSYSCTKCETVFNSETALHTHMRTHKSESERRYQCSFEGCNKKFNFAHHLKHHELTHTNTKQYFCKVCGKGFIQSHHLKTHLKTHNADFSLHCTFPDCNKKFATEYAKKRHVTKCHIKTDCEMSSDPNSPGDTLIPSILKDTEDNDCAETHHLNLGAQNNANLLYSDDLSESYRNLSLEHAKESYPVNYYDSESPLAAIFTKVQEEDHNNSMLINHSKFIKSIPQDLSINTPNGEENLISSSLTNRTSCVNDCKLAVGSCIMSEQSENCVCAQISESVNEDYDFTPIDSDSFKITQVSTNDNSTYKENQCCGGSCGLKNDEIPEMEFKIDGTVKIKEFMDLDSTGTELYSKNVGSENNDVKFIPYNSCKAILGNCIVSGNGTIGDGCLCAKMIADEQVTAEEIEDITPHPKGLGI